MSSSKASARNVFLISVVCTTWLVLALTFAAFAVHTIDFFMISLFIILLSAYVPLVVYTLLRPSHLIAITPLSVIAITLFLFITVSSHQATRFGLNAVDAYFYEKNTIQLVTTSSTFSKFIVALQEIPFSDWGFFSILSLMFYITSEYHTSLIILNLILHVISSYLLFKTSMEFEISRKPSLAASTLFLLNPGSIIFMQLGLKEVVFTFVVTLIIYASAKFIRRRSINWLILAFLLSIVTGFFRIYFPGVLGLYLLTIYFRVQRPKIEKITVLIIILALFLYLLILVSDELRRLASLDFSAVRATRLGSGGGTVDFIGLIYASAVGPFPRFDFLFDEKSLFSLADLYKNTISVLVLTVVLRKLFARELPIFLWLLVPLFLNGLFISLTALSFDYRFHYPLLPVLFVFLSYVLDGRKFTRLLYVTLPLNFCFIMVYN